MRRVNLSFTTCLRSHQKGKLNEWNRSSKVLVGAHVNLLPPVNSRPDSCNWINSCWAHPPVLPIQVYGRRVTPSSLVRELSEPSSPLFLFLPLNLVSSPTWPGIFERESHRHTREETQYMKKGMTKANPEGPFCGMSMATRLRSCGHASRHFLRAQCYRDC